MKKLFLLFVVLFGFIISFSFAKDPGKLSGQQKIFQKQSLKIQQKPALLSGQLSGEKKQLSGIFLGAQKGQIPLLSGNKTLIKVGSGTQKKILCITGDKLIVRDSLSKKALEASQKLSSLVQTSSKVGYNTKNIASLAKNLQNLSSQIAKDCLPTDFQTHRQKIKTDLDSLKVEIQLFKQYVARLHTR